jgi:hypothetical protein
MWTRKETTTLAKDMMIAIAGAYILSAAQNCKAAMIEPHDESNKHFLRACSVDSDVLREDDDASQLVVLD